MLCATAAHRAGSAAASSTVRCNLMSAGSHCSSTLNNERNNLEQIVLNDIEVRTLIHSPVSRRIRNHQTDTTQHVCIIVTFPDKV
jgi:hypothetical protein